MSERGPDQTGTEDYHNPHLDRRDLPHAELQHHRQPREQRVPRQSAQPVRRRESRARVTPQDRQPADEIHRNRNECDQRQRLERRNVEPADGPAVHVRTAEAVAEAGTDEVAKNVVFVQVGHHRGGGAEQSDHDDAQQIRLE